MRVLDSAIICNNHQPDVASCFPPPHTTYCSVTDNMISLHTSWPHYIANVDNRRQNMVTSNIYEQPNSVGGEDQEHIENGVAAQFVKVLAQILYIQSCYGLVRLEGDRFLDIFIISVVIQRLCVQILHGRYQKHIMCSNITWQISIIYLSISEIHRSRGGRQLS